MSDTHKPSGRAVDEGCLWKALSIPVSLLLVVSMGAFIYDAPSLGLAAATPFGLWVLWWTSMVARANGERESERMAAEAHEPVEVTAAYRATPTAADSPQQESRTTAGPSAMKKEVAPTPRSASSSLVDRAPRVLGECAVCGSEYMSGDNWCECGKLIPVWDCTICGTISPRKELNSHCSGCSFDTYLGNGPWRTVRAIKDGGIERAPILKNGF